MEAVIRKLKNILQKCIYKYSKEIKFRLRNITLVDIIYCCCLVIGNNISYDNANTKLKIEGIVDTSTQSIINYKNNIHYEYFNKLNDDLLSFIYRNTSNRILAVDGTRISLLKLLSKDGFKLSRSKNYCTALISTIFDVKREIPINYGLSLRINERIILLEQLKYINRGDTLIMDRGYYSHNLLYQLNNAGIKVIFRSQSNLKHISKMKQKNDIIVFINYANTKIKFRILKYQIDEEIYYLGTTIYNHNIIFFKNLYWKRWKIEINFRHSKYNLKMNNIISKSKNAILQDICIHNFLFMINSYLQYELQKDIDIFHKINTTTHLDIITNYIIKLLIYKKCTDNNINQILKILNITKKSTILIRPDRSYPRKRIFPSSKWCEYGNKYGTVIG
jgi:hypothetical protein